MRIKSWRKYGTHDFADWQPGKQVLSVSELKLGDVLFSDSEECDALNMCKVHTVKKERGLVYVKYCNPFNTDQPRLADDHDFVIWDFDLPSDIHEGRYFFAEKQTAEII
jgi:hypothetical protein